MATSLPPPYDQINYYQAPTSSNTIINVNYKLRRPSISFLTRADLPNSIVDEHLGSASYASPMDIRFPTPPPPYSQIDKKIPIENLPDSRKNYFKCNQRRLYIKILLAIAFVMATFLICLQFAFIYNSQKFLSTKILMACIYEFALVGYIGMLGVCIYALRKPCSRIWKKFLSYKSSKVSNY